jgi:hypothetical protein
MKRTLRLSLSAFCALALAACAGDPSINREAAVELAPMARPQAANLPKEVQGLNKGEAFTQKLIDIKGETITQMISDGAGAGCSWTADGWFAPAVNYSDCGGFTGSQEIQKTGDIWPLEVGKTESYQVNGKSSDGQETWQTTRNCEVKSAVLVSLEDRQLPTYEVVCTDKWNTRTWYVSPELGQPVKYKRYSNSRGLLDDISLKLQ